MNEVRIVGNDLIISVDEVTATIENAALIEDNKRLQAENAKLRELLSETLMPFDDYAKKYGIAPYFLDVNEHIDARMRELGVEV